eukprot:6930871-Alexandrium_andersonii.AAC.1
MCIRDRLDAFTSWVAPADARDQHCLPTARASTLVSLWCCVMARIFGRRRGDTIKGSTGHAAPRAARAPETAHRTGDRESHLP